MSAMEETQKGGLFAPLGVRTWEQGSLAWRRQPLGLGSFGDTEQQRGGLEVWLRRLLNFVQYRCTDSGGVSPASVGDGRFQAAGKTRARVCVKRCMRHGFGVVR